jgi:hypothetical protein
MEEIKFDIVEYIGKLDDGIYVSLSLNYNDEYFDSVFFYKKDLVALTPDERLEELLGCEVEDWVGYGSLMLKIIDRVVPYDEMINRIDEFDKNVYKIVYQNQ